MPTQTTNSQQEKTISSNAGGVISVGDKVSFTNTGISMEKLGVPGKRYPAVLKSLSPVTIEFTGAMPQGSKTMTFPTKKTASDSLYKDYTGGKRKTRKGRKASRKGTYRRRR